jgi:hypothetical protein
LPIVASPLWTLFALIANRDDMTDREEKNSTRKSAPSRDDRLKAALKANMAKRKAQKRARNNVGDNKEKE